jgi:hydroxymethylglutaryl-CoA synthase
MRGILGWGTYLPYRRLDLSSIAAVAGTGGGRGLRTVASYDEDTTTMGVEAARRALASYAGPAPSSLWFSTVDPAYFDKANGTVVHAALRLGRDAPAYDALGSVRSAMGALRAALSDGRPSLVVASDLRTGLPGSPDEATGGDGAAALVVGEGDVLAEVVAWGAATEELVDRWRTPGEPRSKLWEERFGETRYVELALEAWARAGADAERVDHLIVAGPHGRANTAATRKLGVVADKIASDLTGTVGNTGAAHPALLLACVLERATPGQLVALASLADGADVVLLRTTEALADRGAVAPVADQVATGGPVAYGKFLAWRGLLPVEPPRRPEPARPSSSASSRNADWKYGFVGSQGDDDRVHLPPAPSDSVSRPMADVTGTVVTLTVDRLAYSPSPPVVFAVVDFDGGGRLPVELTDVDPDDVAIGTRVEMTFRRLFTADGIHNYFWKARPIR